MKTEQINLGIGTGKIGLIIPDKKPYIRLYPCTNEEMEQLCKDMTRDILNISRRLESV